MGATISGRARTDASVVAATTIGICIAASGGGMGFNPTPTMAALVPLGAGAAIAISNLTRVCSRRKRGAEDAIEYEAGWRHAFAAETQDVDW
jgi:hypothetical protein